MNTVGKSLQVTINTVSFVVLTDESDHDLCMAVKIAEDVFALHGVDKCRDVRFLAVILELATMVVKRKNEVHEFEQKIKNLLTLFDEMH